MSDSLQLSAAATSADRRRALRILAKSVFKELQSNGCDRNAMLAFTNELLDLVTSDLREDIVGDAE